MWCVARFGTNCTIYKAWKTPMKECFSRFLNCTDASKSRKASQITNHNFWHVTLATVKHINHVQMLSERDNFNYHFVVVTLHFSFTISEYVIASMSYLASSSAEVAIRGFSSYFFHLLRYLNYYIKIVAKSFTNTLGWLQF